MISMMIGYPGAEMRRSFYANQHGRRMRDAPPSTNECLAQFRCPMIGSGKPLRCSLLPWAVAVPGARRDSSQPLTAADRKKTPLFGVLRWL
jgi:hypothetical protein